MFNPKFIEAAIKLYGFLQSDKGCIVKCNRAHLLKIDRTGYMFLCTAIEYHHHIGGAYFWPIEGYRSRVTNCFENLRHLDPATDGELISKEGLPGPFSSHCSCATDLSGVKEKVAKPAKFLFTYKIFRFV